MAPDLFINWSKWIIWNCKSTICSLKSENYSNSNNDDENNNDTNDKI